MLIVNSTQEIEICRTGTMFRYLYLNRDNSNIPVGFLWRKKNWLASGLGYYLIIRNYAIMTLPLLLSILL